MKKLLLIQNEKVDLKPIHYTTGFIPFSDNNVYLICKPQKHNLDEQSIASFEMHYETEGLTLIVIDENSSPHLEGDAALDTSGSFLDSSPMSGINVLPSLYDRIFFYLHLPMSAYEIPFLMRYIKEAIVVTFINQLNGTNPPVLGGSDLLTLLQENGIEEIKPDRNEDKFVDPAGNVKKILQEYRTESAKNKTYIEISGSADFNTILPHLSRLVLTPKYEIILPDYDIIINLGPLPKALFLLFLQYPDGIHLSELYEYKEELVRLYSMVTNFALTKDELRKNIDLLTDPIDNSIHVNLSRIKRVFLSRMDPNLAAYYFISGVRGEIKKVYLPYELIDIRQLVQKRYE